MKRCITFTLSKNRSTNNKHQDGLNRIIYNQLPFYLRPLDQNQKRSQFESKLQRPKKIVLHVEILY